MQSGKVGASLSVRAMVLNPNVLAGNASGQGIARPVAHVPAGQFFPLSVMGIIPKKIALTFRETLVLIPKLILF